MPQNLKQLVFSDFSRGIVNNTRGVPGKLLSEPGIAQASGTFRCIALPSGGLGPLPKSTIFQSIPDVSPTALGNTIVVVGLDVIPQVHPTAAGLTSTVAHHDELHVGLVWADVGSPFHINFRWYALRTADNNSTLIKSLATGIPGSPLFPTPFFTAKTRLRSAAARSNISLAASWEAPTGATPRLWWWPDPAAPSSATPVESTAVSGALLAHSGRILLLDWQSAVHGSGVYLSNEHLSFSAPPLSTSMGSQAMLFGADNPVGYGAWCSTAQGELFLVKTSGGAIVVAGELAVPNPPVGVIPFAPSTGHVIQRASGTPIGIVYCSENYAYLWNGQSAELLSPQLAEGSFIRPDSETGVVFSPRIYNQKHISHVAWGNYVLFPNNWLLDTVGRGFWRLEESATTYQLYAVSGPTLWATTGIYSPGTAGQVKAYRINTAVSSYSWQSHPISVSSDRYVDIREIEIIAQAASGDATVSIVLTNAAGGSVTETFNITQADQPMRIRKTTSAKGYNVVMRIDAASNSEAIGAPLVLSVSLGYHDSHTTART